MTKKEEEVVNTRKRTSKKASIKKINSNGISTEEVSPKDASTTQVKKKKNKVYFNYISRFLFNVLLFELFFIICMLFATKTIDREKVEPIKYNDVNNTTYKVYLNQNDVYEEEYLDMNRAYVANLIDSVDIDFNYLFNIEQLTTMTFDYKIIANLVIENVNGTNYVDRDYVLKDSTKKELEDGGATTINESITIDYEYYNALANKFKAETGVDTTSYLNVYMIVNKKTDPDLNYKINENTKLNVKIPLSEKAIEININSNDKMTTKEVTPKGNIIFNVEYLILEIAFFIITCIFLSSSIRLMGLMIKVKTPYDKYVKKLLKEYDRLIVETKAIINMDDCKIIEVKSFTELLDVRDNLKLPILYLNIVEHEKGIFYIKNNMDVYLLVVKNSSIIENKI